MLIDVRQSTAAETEKARRMVKARLASHQLMFLLHKRLLRLLVPLLFLVASCAIANAVWAAEVYKRTLQGFTVSCKQSWLTRRVEECSASKSTEISLADWGATQLDFDIIKTPRGVSVYFMTSALDYDLTGLMREDSESADIKRVVIGSQEFSEQDLSDMMEGDLEGDREVKAGKVASFLSALEQNKGHMVVTFIIVDYPSGISFEKLSDAEYERLEMAFTVTEKTVKLSFVGYREALSYLRQIVRQHMD